MGLFLKGDYVIDLRSNLIGKVTKDYKADGELFVAWKYGRYKVKIETVKNVTKTLNKLHKLFDESADVRIKFIMSKIRNQHSYPTKSDFEYMNKIAKMTF